MPTRPHALLAGVATALLIGGSARAETLHDALVKAYNTNPTLTAGRAGQRALDEGVPLARANGLPSVAVNAQYTENVARAATDFTTPARQVTVQPQLVVPLYAGGGIRNAVKAADTRVDAGRLNLRDIEAQVFSAAVGAYMDVIRDEAIVSLNNRNVHVLDVNLQASRDRFQVGDLTRTDVAQSEARLEQARSQLQSAKSRLISSRENYIRVVGGVPGVLETPPGLPNLPVNPEKAVDIALNDNPALLAAQKSRDATVFDVRAAGASRLPRINGVVSGTYYNYFNSGIPAAAAVVGNNGRSAAVGMQLSLPLYQGGGPTAQVRQAQERRAQANEQVTETERAIVSQTRSAYAVWQSSLEVITSSEAAVSANRLSLEGVRAENSVGSRTILDILNAEQELLNSQVTLVTAQHDAYVAGFTLLAAMGKAEARDLGLEGVVPYDPTDHYRRTRNTIWDFGAAPAPTPVATSTALTPPQDAKTTTALDPIFDVPLAPPRPQPTKAR